jgi:hypothetical protein
VIHAGLTSPFAATFAIPLDVEISVNNAAQASAGNLPLLANYAAFSILANAALLLTMIWLFNMRWRVSESSQ